MIALPRISPLHSGIHRILAVICVLLLSGTELAGALHASPECHSTASRQATVVISQACDDNSCCSESDDCCDEPCSSTCHSCSLQAPPNSPAVVTAAAAMIPSARFFHLQVCTPLDLDLPAPEEPPRA
jgi:hypothetical protein